MVMEMLATHGGVCRDVMLLCIPIENEQGVSREIRNRATDSVTEELLFVALHMAKQGSMG